MYKEDKYIVYVDGGCYNNGTVNAEAYGSFSIYKITNNQTNLDYQFSIDPNDQQMRPYILKAQVNPNQPQHKGNVTLIENTKFIIAPYGGKVSNNIAEAVSLETAIKKLTVNNILIPKQLNTIIYMDSKLTINQYTGLWKGKDKTLKSIQHSIKDYVKNKDVLLSFIIGWIPNELMKEVLGH